MLHRRHNSGLNFKQCAVFKAHVSVGVAIGVSIGNVVVDGGGGVAIGGVVVVDRGVVTIGVGNAIFLAFVSFSRC